MGWIQTANPATPGGSPTGGGVSTGTSGGHPVAGRPAPVAAGPLEAGNQLTSVGARSLAVARGPVTRRITGVGVADTSFGMRGARLAWVRSLSFGGCCDLRLSEVSIWLLQ
jgi:hypothetical protein